MSVPTTDLSPELQAIADGLTQTLQAHDVDAWGSFFAPDAVNWHSYDGAEMPASANVELLRGLFAGLVDELRYEDIRRYVIAGGFMQQHTLHLLAHNGATYTTGVCFIVHVRDGRIHRSWEYLDSGVLQFGVENGSAPPEA